MVAGRRTTHAHPTEARLAVPSWTCSSERWLIVAGFRCGARRWLPVGSDVFVFEWVVDPWAVRTGTGLAALEDEQRAAHVVAPLAALDFLGAGGVDPPGFGVRGSELLEPVPGGFGVGPSVADAAVPSCGGCPAGAAQAGEQVRASGRHAVGPSGR